MGTQTNTALIADYEKNNTILFYRDKKGEITIFTGKLFSFITNDQVYDFPYTDIP